MSRFLLLTLTLTSCNQWIRPNPSESHVRNVDEQKRAAVAIEMNCDPFEDGGKTKVGSGVMVSDWQVLTALHVVECKSAIPTIHVTTSDGHRYLFAPEKEWKSVDVARIQMASGDHLSPRLSPPTLRDSETTAYEPLYVQAAKPDRRTVLGESSGWEYTMDPGRTFSYRAPTEEGCSGSGIYDWDGQLVGIHLGVASVQYGARVSSDMVPHR